LADYALASAGGHVMPGLHSETYRQKTQCSNNVIGWVRGLFGNCYSRAKTPNEMLTNEMKAGSCWPMKGSNGYAVIRLRQPIIIRSFSFEHLPLSIAYDNSTAPRQLEFLGITAKEFEEAKKSQNGVGPLFGQSLTGEKLAQMTYQLGDVLPIQIQIQNPAGIVYDYVKLNILSNHNNPSYTCIYRVRVHGQPVDSPDKNY